MPSAFPYICYMHSMADVPGYVQKKAQERLLNDLPAGLQFDDMVGHIKWNDYLHNGILEPGPRIYIKPQFGDPVENARHLLTLRDGNWRY